MTELLGESLGQFKIVDQIAKGGMATVYRARQESVGRDVAIKLLPQHMAQLVVIVNEQNSRFSRRNLTRV